MEYNCKIEDKPAQPTLGARAHTSVENLSVFLAEAFGEVIEYLELLGEVPSGPPYAVYYNMDMQNLDVEAGFPVEKMMPGDEVVHPGEVPAGQRASVLHAGPYDKLGDAYQTLTDFIKEEGYEPSGVAYEFYLNSPREFPPEKLETLIVFPLNKASG